ncbi:hypothetical protein VNO77_26774 [Canavalia gladiata]|uniref:Uncharacterized protein n=1 Tax=Canavalia gladiata TaxID=3824 RepID=A0AAN9KTG7_CANGL
MARDSVLTRVATGAAVGGAIGGAVGEIPLPLFPVWFRPFHPAKHGAVYGTYDAIRYKHQYCILVLLAQMISAILLIAPRTIPPVDLLYFCVIIFLELPLCLVEVPFVLPVAESITKPSFLG